PQTPNPEPETQNTKSWARNLKPETRSPDPQTRNPKPPNPNPKPQTLSSQGCRSLPSPPRAQARRPVAIQPHERDWYFIAEQLAPAPHLARPVGRAALTHIC
ncbi:hypothetical protein T484DRAFT_1649590, partial [Baffinella frigidus]